MKDEDAADPGVGLLVLRFAHDLRQPLRAMVTSVQRALRHGSELPEEVRRSLDDAVAAARRQDALIAAVVEYVSAGENSESVAIPLGLAIRSACIAMDEFRKQEGGTVSLPEHPHTANAPAAAIKCIERVLHNALKFHAPGAAPDVRIAVRDTGAGAIAVCITDNGIGIPAAQRQRVFEPFTRLQPADEYPGAGLGLATCRRALALIGGTIQVEGPGPGEPGTVVILQLPVIE